jgi:O-antigen/teichoic acid export membrane protein
MTKDSSAQRYIGDRRSTSSPLGTPPVSGVVAGRLARSSTIAFGIHVAGAGLTYCSQMVLARVVGPVSYGIYAYILAWATILAYLSALGFEVSLLRLVPVYRARRDWALLRGVILYAEWRVTCTGFAIVLIGTTIVTLWDRGSPEQTNAFLTGFVLVPVWALLWIRSSVVRALGGVFSALAPDRIIRDGLLLVFIGLASSLTHWTVDASFAVLATLVSSTVGLGLVSVAATRRRPPATVDIRPEYDRRTWRRAALPLVLLAVMDSALNRTGVVLLGWTGHIADAGIYALAFNITFMVALPRTAVNAMFAPLVADLFARNERDALQRLIAKTSCWTLLGATGMSLPLAIFAEPLLALFGPEFVAGASAMRILLVGQVIAGAAGSQLYLMTMTGHERAAAVLLILSTIANVTGSLLLINLLGLSGAAIGTTAAVIAWNGAMALFIRRSLRLVPGVLGAFGQRPVAAAWLGTSGVSAGE